MYAVIFRAEIASLDEAYTATAEKLRELALTRYGCREFCSYMEGSREIAISYWDSEADIVAWKNDLEHLAAQNRGRARWYRSYSVQVVEVVREYGSSH